jgi:hypothetical protein
MPTLRRLHVILQPPESGGADALESLVRAMPGLRTLLGRGRTLPHTACVSEACCAALDIHRQQDWPLAPFTARGAGLATGEGYWLRLDPVFLDVGLRGLFLRAGVLLSPKEAEVLGALMQSILAHHGLDSWPMPDGTCHVRLDRPPQLSTAPLDLVDDRQPTRFLPQGGDAPFWNRLMQEIQMALHDHPINQARETAGLPPVNSYWAWGGGLARMPPTPLPERVWTDVPLVRQLAQGLGIESLPLPEAQSILASRDVQHGLVVLDAAAWSRTPSPQDLDAYWFRPLVAALRWGRLRTLSVRLADGIHPGRHLGPLDAWRPG